MRALKNCVVDWQAVAPWRLHLKGEPNARVIAYYLKRMCMSDAAPRYISQGAMNHSQCVLVANALSTGLASDRVSRLGFR